MKTLEALLEENQAIVTNEGSTDKDGNYVPLVMITLDSLEKVINEVISQRAGEPVGFISSNYLNVVNKDNCDIFRMRPSNRGKDIPVFLSFNNSKPIGTVNDCEAGYYIELLPESDRPEIKEGDKVYLASDSIKHLLT